jgi:hypothetical protein
LPHNLGHLFGKDRLLALILQEVQLAMMKGVISLPALDWPWRNS